MKEVTYEFTVFFTGFEPEEEDDYDNFNEVLGRLVELQKQSVITDWDFRGTHEV